METVKIEVPVLRDGDGSVICRNRFTRLRCRFLHRLVDADGDLVDYECVHGVATSPKILKFGDALDFGTEPLNAPECPIAQALAGKEV